MGPELLGPANAAFHLFNFFVLLYLLSFINLSASREVVFPPIAAVHPNGGSYQVPLAEDDPTLETWGIAGLTTFANLPHVDCMSQEDKVPKYDVAFLGAPFDTLELHLPGARFGPSGIREGSRRIVPGFATSIYSGRNDFQSWARAVDCGDAPLTFLDNTVALKQLESAHRSVSSREANATEKSRTPRIITLGGDHTTTLPALRATYQNWGPVSVIHFDSHIDTWDPSVLGGGISHYAGVNHGTFLHIAHEEGLVLNGSSVHAGIRAPVRKGDLKNDRRCGFEIVTARDIDRIGVQGVIERLKERVAETLVYISVDIDVLDPSYAPATGTPEVGGWTSRELLSILDGLEGLKVIGADVVEVAPIYDTRGETTTLAAAEVAYSLFTLMVETPVKSRRD
ncbi:MAG: hypothetical protein Q9227_006495 [Pyrenula ochraceoflavens]